MLRHLMLACFFIASAGPVAALDAGARLFGLHCAVCHGEAATGDGPMAKALKIETPDLTTLSIRNEGTFPLARVVGQIDGRNALQAHGGAMPVYGWFFKGPATAVSGQNTPPVETTAPIAQIIDWLQSVQQSP